MGSVYAETDVTNTYAYTTRSIHTRMRINALLQPQMKPSPLLLILGALSLLPTGCDPGTQDADFRFVSASAHHYLDPQKISWSHDFRIVECLFEPLVKVEPDDLRIEPAVASAWDVADDAKTYTFHLRPDARWSNGDPVTSHDFVYAWRRAMLPDLAADYTQLFFHIEGAEAFFGWRSKQLTEYQQPGTTRSPAAAQRLWEQAQHQFTRSVGLSTPDDRTLVVKLTRPTPYFLQLCAFATFMPVHAASLESKTSINPETGMLTQDPTWTKPPHLISNGPYTLNEWKFKRHLLLTANPHYWSRATMANDSILEMIIESPQTALLRYDNNQVDWLPDIPTAKPIAADLIHSRRPDVHAGPAAGTYFYNFNCKPQLNDGSANPLADPRVRTALSMCIDRQTIVERVTRLSSVQPTASTFVPPNTLQDYAPPTDTGVRFNPQRATSLLAEAGYPDGQGLTGLSILYNTEGGHGDIAQQIRHAWLEHLGVTIKLEAVESKRFSERLKNQDYTICRASWFGDYRDATTFLDKMVTGNGNNDCAWSDTRYDTLIRSAADQTDPAKRTVTLQEAETLMLKQQPIAPIFHYINLWLYDPDRVQGLPLNPWRVRRLERVKILK